MVLPGDDDIVLFDRRKEEASDLRKIRQHLFNRNQIVSFAKNAGNYF